MARLKELEDENWRLKKMYAEERLKYEIVQEALQKKVVKQSRLKAVALNAVDQKRARIRLVCAAVGISETCYRYSPKLSDDNAQITDWLFRLTHNQKNWGFGLCTPFLRNVKGFGWNSISGLSPGNGSFEQNPSRLPYRTVSTNAGQWTLCTTSYPMAIVPVSLM